MALLYQSIIAHGLTSQTSGLPIIELAATYNVANATFYIHTLLQEASLTHPTQY